MKMPESCVCVCTKSGMMIGIRCTTRTDNGFLILLPSLLLPKCFALSREKNEEDVVHHLILASVQCLKPKNSNYH